MSQINFNNEVIKTRTKTRFVITKVHIWEFIAISFENCMCKMQILPTALIYLTLRLSEMSSEVFLRRFYKQKKAITPKSNKLNYRISTLDGNKKTV